MSNKKYDWTEEDMATLFNGMVKILKNQEQIINGIIALAKKEGMEVTIKDKDGEVKFEGEEK